MATCRKIVNWKKTLHFPDEAKLTPESKDLIQRMVCDANKRITFEEMKVHPFFRGVNWDSIRSTKAPIVPALASDIDTSHFDKFEDQEEEELDANRDPKQNDAFIGYTFKRVEDPKKLEASFFDAPA